MDLFPIHGHLPTTLASCRCPTAPQWRSLWIRQRRWSVHLVGICSVKFAGERQFRRWSRICPRQPLKRAPGSFFVARGTRRIWRSGHPGTSSLQPDRRREFERREQSPRGTITLRNTLVEKRASFEKKVTSIFTSDYSFSVRICRSRDRHRRECKRPNFWKLPDGRNYADWEASQDVANGSSG